VLRIGLAILATTSMIATARAGGHTAPRLPRPGSYERLSLERALTARDLKIEYHPEGKRLRRIHVVNLEVFSPRDGRLLRWFNIFHKVTRESHVRREVVLRPGQLWDARKLRETSRRLRDPIFTTLVVVVPVQSATARTFDLLVVTRDVWSLRFNSRFEYQEGKLTEASLSLSENNFFGRRKQMAFVFNLDQGKYTLGPQYIDKNLAGTRLQLLGRASAVFGRKSSELEGASSRVVFGYPLWSLATPGGATLDIAYSDTIIREFLGIDPYTFDADVTPEDDAIPWQYRLNTISVEASATRQIGRHVIHRFTGGYDLDRVHSSLAEAIAATDPAIAEFVDRVLPRSETISSPFLGYRMFTPRFIQYRDIDTYDLSEDATLGPDLRVRVEQSLEVLGSSANHLAATLQAKWTEDLRHDGFVRVGASAIGRLQSGKLIDNRLDAAVAGVSWRFANTFRVVGRASLSLRVNEQNRRFLTLGGRTGLRGYAIGQFRGQARFVGNVEVRTMPIRLWFSRLGGLVFWDVGHAAGDPGDSVGTSLGALSLHQDVGVGLRWLLPQLSPLVYRFDWAFATRGPTAGFPGRFTAGVAQVF
jgi:hypothetical protein